MKKNLFILSLSFVILAACSSEDDNTENFDAAAEMETISNLATSANWRISKYIDSGQDETVDYDGFLFSFLSNDLLIAQNDSTEIEGRWFLSVELDDDGTLDNDCDQCTTSLLADVLSGCSDWFIDKLEIADQDLDELYASYQFDFGTDGSITATSGNESFEGSWEASGQGNNITVTIDFPGIEEINLSWNLHEIEVVNGEVKVDLRVGDNERLRFKNRCVPDADLSLLNDGKGKVKFNISFSSPPDFEELSDDWDILSFSNNTIELIDESGDGSTDMLTFEKN